MYKNKYLEKRVEASSGNNSILRTSGKLSQPGRQSASGAYKLTNSKKKK